MGGLRGSGQEAALANLSSFSRATIDGFFIYNAQSTAKVMSGRNTSHQLANERLIHLFMPYITLCWMGTGKKLKLNGSGRQKLETYSFWQWAKHAQLYSDLFQASQKEPLIALGSLLGR